MPTYAACLRSVAGWDKKQVLLIVLSLGLFGAACLSGAIMAYHVYESKEAVNVFTVGDVKVETVESSWDMNDADHDGVPDNAAYIMLIRRNMWEDQLNQ